MLITVKKLSLNFNENEEEMEHLVEELTKLKNAIENSAHYKLLAGKTQMLGRGKGNVKKERSRLLHTNSIVELVVVPQIEQIYNRILKENPVFQNEEYKRKFELNKKIAILRGICMTKAHDLGHVPFGHEGERAINRFVSTIVRTDYVEAVLKEHLEYFGKEYEEKQGHIDEDSIYEFFPQTIDRQLSFEHNELGGIILNRIIERNGINLSKKERLALTLGVLGHSTSRTPFELLSKDLIAQIVRTADKIEYINYDYEELADLIKIDSSNISKEQLEFLGKSVQERIKKTNNLIVEEAFNIGQIHEKNPTMRNLTEIRGIYTGLIYLYDGVFADELIKKLLYIVDNPEKLNEFYKNHPGVETVYSKEVLNMFIKYRDLTNKSKQENSNVSYIDLINAYDRVITQQLHFKGVMQGENSDRISLIYSRILQYYYEHPDEIPQNISRNVNPIDFVKSEEISYSLQGNYNTLQKILEYISLFDDQELMEQYQKLVQKRITEGEGHGIQPINIEETKMYLGRVYEQEVDKYRLNEDNDNIHSITEARKKYNSISRNYFETRLTRRGKEVMMQNYKKRFEEYAKDQALYETMKKKDAEREIGGVEK